MKRRGWRQLAALPVALICAGLFVWPHGKPDASAAPAVTLYTDVRDELLALLDRSDPRVALTRLDELIRERPGVAGVCHIAAHELGREALRETGSFARAMSYRVDVCGGGYVHGAVEARLAGQEHPQRAMRRLCGARPDQQCLHGLGHGAMLVTGNDLPAALRMCQGLPAAAGRLACSDGVFMQHFQTDLQGPHENRFLDPKDPGAVCRDQRGAYRTACESYVPIYYQTLRHSAVTSTKAAP